MKRWAVQQERMEFPGIWNDMGKGYKVCRVARGEWEDITAET